MFSYGITPPIQGSCWKGNAKKDDDGGDGDGAVQSCGEYII
jgi:hypothetical protein